MTFCLNCRLCKTRNKIVWGEGPTNPKLMIIGEAPGREEDESGRPFCGGAGRVLSSLLKFAGLSREECFITNIVKCRPPNNRDPEPDEIQACIPFLIEEINKVKPTRILTLGNYSSILLTGKPLSPYRGCVLHSQPYLGNISTVITYHPAWLMRGNQKYFSVILNDILKVFKDWPDYPEQYYVNLPLVTGSPVLQLMETWKDKWVAVDIETAGDKEEDDSGLNPWKDEIIGISFCGEPGKAVHFSSGTLLMSWPYLKQWLESHKFLVFHNGIFDRMFLLKKGISCSSVWDTQIAMYLTHSGLPKKLDFVRSLHTNMLPYKHVYRSQGIANLSTDNLARYNNLDVDSTLRSCKSQVLEVSSTLMQRQIRQDNIAIKMRDFGIYINKDILASHYLDVAPQMQEIEIEFAKEGVEVTSPKQLSEYIYKKLSFSPAPWAYKKTLISTDEDAITYLIRGCVGEIPEKQVLLNLMKYRELEKIANTYCTGIFKRIQPDGLVHPDWRPTGADTGRWACKNPPIQTIPKHLRDMFQAREGKVYIAGDYDRIEIWVAALLAEDQELLDLLRQGIDVHGIVLQEIEKKYPLTQYIGATQARLRAKAVVFGTFYGRSAKDIAQEFQVTTPIVADWQDIFFSKFKKLGVLFRETIPKQFQDHGFTETFYGKRKYSEKITEAMNQPIQGTAAEVFVNALFKLDEKGFHPNIVVHDQLLAEEDDSCVEEKMAEFKFILETSSPELYPLLPASCASGKNWKEVS